MHSELNVHNDFFVWAMLILEWRKTFVRGIVDASWYFFRLGIASLHLCLEDSNIVVVKSVRLFLDLNRLC